MQCRAVIAHGGQLTVQVQGCALADLVAGALQDGVCHFVFIQSLMGHGNGVGRFHGPLCVVGAGVIDTLLHCLTGGVEHVLVGHIAHGLAVHLHFQRVGLTDGFVEHGHHDCQCTHRQHIHGHPRQGPDIAAHAAGQIMYTFAAGHGKAFFFAHPMGVDQQGAAAPEKQPDGPEQVPEHLCSARECDGCHIPQQCRSRVPQPQPAAAQAASGADEYILGGVAQRIQRLTNDRNGSVLGDLSAEIAYTILRFTAQPMPVQKPHALQLCPKGAQLLPPLGLCR